MNFNSGDEIIQTSDDKETVKVRFNRKEYIEVNRQKLLESSPYFQSMLSSCFNDHKNEFVEVNYPASFETFEKAMQFVTKGDMDINDENIIETFGLSMLFGSSLGLELTDENIFDTFELADYLQMDISKKWCLDQFTSSLTRDNVQTKFNLLKPLHFPVDEFKQRVFSFIENISCGLYFIEIDMYNNLKLFLGENNFLNKNGCYYNNHSYHNACLDLHRIHNTLVICPSTGSKYKKHDTVGFMIMYDLITGKTKETKLNFEGPAVSCSNEKNVFVISFAKRSSNKRGFSIETFNIVNYSTFQSTKEIIDYNFIESGTVSDIHFAHCFSDKIYIFYQTRYFDKLERDFENVNHMMIVCEKK